MVLFLAVSWSGIARADVSWASGWGPTKTHWYSPDGYDYRTAVVVVYLHGFGSNVDQAWKGYHLPEQFRDAEVNAFFVVPETRKRPGEPVRGPEALNQYAGPHERIVLVAHSGGYRQAAAWLGDRRVVGVVLLDAAYGSGRAFSAWQARGGHLVAVGNGTAAYAQAWLSQGVVQATSDGHHDIAAGGTWMRWALQHLRAMGVLTRTRYDFER